MKITITSTDQLTKIDGVPVRRWDGMTERGVPCYVFVHRIVVKEDEDCAQFEAELRQEAAPDGPRMVPLSMIL